MENPRPEKVAVVDEVRTRISEADATILTEYRGLTVAEISQLRRNLSEAGGDYKVYKNTLVRFAVDDLGLGELSSLLTGPTAIAFVKGDAVAVAKALKDFGKGNPNLVVKGGLLGDKFLSEADTSALADIAPREELLARLAGGMAAPMQAFAGLLAALPLNFAYALKALVDARGGAPEPEAEAEPEPEQAAEVQADTAEPTPEPEPAAEVQADTAEPTSEAAEPTPEAAEAETAEPTPEAPTAETTAEAAPTNVPQDAAAVDAEPDTAPAPAAEATTPDSETPEASTDDTSESNPSEN